MEMQSGVLRDTFRSRTVLVTGHTGFKGCWLTAWLVELGARVVGYALEPDTEPALFALARVAEHCEHVVGDVRDAERVFEVFQRTRPAAVFHLAAQPLVRRSYRAPKETFDVNVGGTVNVLEAVRRTDSVRAAVLVTTDKVYENLEWVYGYREVDALGGHDPYSASKAAAEIAIKAYNEGILSERAGNIGVASARAGNVIGGGDWAEDRIISDAVRAAAGGRTLRVRHPGSVRPWQHVLEPLGGYLALCARLFEEPARFAGAWNFGPLPTDIVRVGQLVDQFYRAYGNGKWEHVPEDDHLLHETGCLKLSCDKAAGRLEWRPVWDTATALRRTAVWYRDVLAAGAEPWSRCRADIETYLDCARAGGAWWAA